jgi:hypothetical protein
VIPYLVAAIIGTISVLATVPWRRTRPLLIFAIGFGASEVFALMTGENLQLYSSHYLLLLAYAVFRWGFGCRSRISRAPCVSRPSVAAPVRSVA